MSKFTSNVYIFVTDVSIIPIRVSANQARLLVIELPARDQILHALCIITSAEAVLYIKLVSLENLLAVNLDTETNHLIDALDAAADDRHRILRKTISALLPDPVCIDTIESARNCCRALSNHCKRNIEVVV